MQYMGGKQQIARKLSDVLLSYKGDCHTYIEPFLGGGSIAQYMVPHFQHAYLGDSHLDLILLWQSLIEGSFTPPAHVSEEEYRILKRSPPSPLRGFVGFGCSYGGRWFEGYARSKTRDNFALSAIRSLNKKLPPLLRATVLHMDYRRWKPYPKCFIYCDPPYAGTKTYSTLEKFSSDFFWSVAQNWCEIGATVFISEYNMPSNVEGVEVARWTRTRQMNNNSDTSTEKLFMLGKTQAFLTPWTDET